VTKYLLFPLGPVDFRRLICRRRFCCYMGETWSLTLRQEHRLRVSGNRCKGERLDNGVRELEEFTERGEIRNTPICNLGL
jgi:hypothetical protein